MLLRLAIRALILQLVSTGMIGPARAAEPPRPIQDFKEEEKKEVGVGGAYVRGFMQEPPLPKPNPERVHVWIPDGGFELLCIVVRSIDGRYEATARYNVASTERGRYSLPFGAKMRRLFDGYGPGELVLDGRVGSNCDAPETLTHVPMAWLETPGTDQLLFFINTDGHDAVLHFPLKANPDQVHSVACRPVPSERPRRIFSAFCVVEQPSSVDFSEAWLELRRFGDVQVSELLDVVHVPMR